MTCESVASVIDLLHEQTTPFRNSRGDDHGKRMRRIKQIVNILRISTYNVLVGRVDLYA
jgi:hypothetical protein